MLNFVNSDVVKKIMNTALLIFAFYVVAAASFNGFFVKWAFEDNSYRYSFDMIYDGTAHRPFVHRQLMTTLAKEISKLIPEKSHQRLADHLERHNLIEEHFAKANINSNNILEYYIVYHLAFLCLFISMFLWRIICTEITGNKTAGTLTSITFALIFPLFETVGGYFYDFSEILFFSAATLFALRGHWIMLILMSPIAEYNKESFLFFIATLFPLLSVKIGKKKSFAILATSIILSGCTYLYLKMTFSANAGGTTELHIFDHINMLTNSWLSLDFQYGQYFGGKTFLPHCIMVIWIVKCVWNKIQPKWKQHICLAVAINVPLYLLFCLPGELRNLSLMYMSFMVIMTVFIKDIAMRNLS